MLYKFVGIITMTLVILLPNDDVVIVDTFDQGIDEGWHLRNQHMLDIYSHVSEPEGGYLMAYANGECNFMIKRLNVDLTKYPYLNWKWRVDIPPTDGDESVKKYCDVGASIAIAYNKSKILPKSLKYSWSTTLARDSLTKSPFAPWPARCDIRVLRGPQDSLGVWYTEKVNVLQDFKKFHDKDKVKRLKGHAIVIMSDADNTESISKPAYDEIYFSKD